MNGSCNNFFVEMETVL